MKKFCLLAVLAVISFNLYSMDVNDPSDMLYRDLEFWQEQGYYRHIPDLKPYSPQYVLSLLEIVLQKGNYKDKEIAQLYYDQINKSLTAKLNLELTTNYAKGEVGETAGTMDVDIQGELFDDLYLWGDISASGVVRYEEPDYYMYYDSVPYGQRLINNRKEDAGEIAGIELMGGTTTMLSYGTEDLYLNLGIYRSSFGPFLNDGVVISDEAYQQGHYELTYNHNNFSYNMTMLSLIGTSNEGSYNYSDDSSDTDMDSLYDKYMVLHSYSWAPYRWLDFGFFESVVYGERFEPLYLLPFGYLFYSQGYAGFADNSLMGLSLRTLLPHNIELNGIIYTDDMDFNGIIKGDFDTKMKMAFETGASWSPGNRWIHKISMDYTAVMPYMYTHYDWHSTYVSTDFNPDNYTHNGANLGTTLSPNSDRINLTGRWRTNTASELTLFGNWMRHGNASESTGASENADGTIYDNGIDSSGELYFQDSLPFLTQDTLEKVLQFGFEYTTTLDMPFQDDVRYYGMEMSLGYTHEWIWNSGRDSSTGPVEGNDENNSYFNISFRVFL